MGHVWGHTGPGAHCAHRPKDEAARGQRDGDLEELLRPEALDEV